MNKYERARKYAVGICAMVAVEDTVSATAAIKEYLAECGEAGMVPFEAMYVLAQAAVTAAVAAAEHTPEGAEDFWRNTAFAMAVN